LPKIIHIRESAPTPMNIQWISSSSEKAKGVTNTSKLEKKIMARAVPRMNE